MNRILLTTLVALGLFGLGYLVGHQKPDLVVPLASAEESPQVAEEPPETFPTCECDQPGPFTPGDKPSVEMVRKAMGVVSQAGGYDLTDLLKLWGQEYDADTLAGLILNNATRHGIDPFLLTAIAWQESKFNWRSEGDFKHGKPRSCGMTAVMTTFRGRPNCKQLKDANYALGWTAQHLSTFPRYCKGLTCLSRYNGGDYEVRVWRLVDLMHRGVLKVEPKVALLPTCGDNG